MGKARPATAAVVLNEPLKGIAFLCTGVFLFSIQDVAIKWMSGATAVHEIVFVRSLVALPLILAIAHLGGGLAALRTRRLGLHLIRGCTAFVAYTSFYMALASLPMADVVAVAFSAPLFVTALSVPVLGERVGGRRWGAVIVGFIGILVMVRPGDVMADPAGLLVVVCAVSYAAMTLITRRLGATDSGISMVFYPTIVYIALSSLTGLFLGDGRWAGQGPRSVEFLLRAWSVPGGFEFALMAGCGVIFAVAFLCLSQAYRVAQPSLVVPFEYTALPLAVVWGYIFWNHLPDLQAVFGIFLVVGSGFYILHREVLRGARPLARRAARHRG